MTSAAVSLSSARKEDFGMDAPTTDKKSLRQKRIPFDPFAGIGEWAAYGVLAVGGFFLLLYGMLCLLVRGMRDFTHRLIALIQRNHA